MRAEHDQIWVGDVDLLGVSPEDEHKLRTWGWFINEEAWSHFV